jgi:hypothetical protein
MKMRKGSNTSGPKGKQRLIPIAQGAGFAGADARVRAQRTLLHELLDLCLDSNNAIVLRALSTGLAIYSEIATGRKPDLAPPVGDLTNKQVRSMRARWHKLLDLVLDKGDANLLTGISCRLKVYRSLIVSKAALRSQKAALRGDKSNQ